MSDSHHALESTPVSASGLTPEHTHCANCGAPLLGPYCHQCGQSTRHMLKHLPALAADASDALLNIDGRLVHTLPALYLRPGFLANEYFRGRRARYISPFRLMFFMSVLAFLVIQLAVNIDPVLTQTVINTHGNTPDKVQLVAPKTDPDSSKHALDALPEHIDIRWLPDFVVQRINAGLHHAKINLLTMLHGSKGARQQAQHRFIGHFLSVTPQTLFVLIPLLAALLKLMYVFKTRLYIEHLIVALYSHAFIFLTLLLSVLLSLLANYLSGWVLTPTALLMAALWTWLPIYLLLMQKRVYAQGWPLTCLKFVCVGTVYSVMLGFALVIAALIGLAS